tara:strand:+ start:402 stop:1058 length:657 start_codon:yes stop_codon:yes gene_type:complete
MITVSNISKSFGDIKVLDKINLKIEKGDLISIIGKSGSGKTTLLNILGSIEKMDEGELKINDRNIKNLKEPELAKIRNEKIGFVFQAHHLLPEFTALENVCLPGFINPKNTKVKDRAKEILTKLNLENRLNHKPHQLSGGEQQRISLARAMINNPDIILADEPTGNLDGQNSNIIFDLIVQLNKEKKITCLFVTHNVKYSKLANKRYHLEKGKLNVLK